ncbi:MAG: ribosome silencing factor [Deltaproteobacteria bacterium]|nr:ribosome silencing factor [Deltaproteobacteria bacterium]
MAHRLLELAEEKKARRTRLLDLLGRTSYTDYVLILGATSDRHARALADHLQTELRAEKIRPIGMEGYESGFWILLDYGSVVVHILQESARDYYDLDGLWFDAKCLAENA